jgi:hypothetical protein
MVTTIARTLDMATHRGLRRRDHPSTAWCRSRRCARRRRGITARQLAFRGSETCDHLRGYVASTPTLTPRRAHPYTCRTTTAARPEPVAAVAAVVFQRTAGAREGEKLVGEGGSRRLPFISWSLGPGGGEGRPRPQQWRRLPCQPLRRRGKGADMRVWPVSE